MNDNKLLIATSENVVNIFIRVELQFLFLKRE
jgi:hypothetical protein